MENIFSLNTSLPHIVFVILNIMCWAGAIIVGIALVVLTFVIIANITKTIFGIVDDIL